MRCSLIGLFVNRVSKQALFTKQKLKMPSAVILAGGLGTRLRSAYAAGPKSMAPVAGKPFLDYLLRWLSSEGVEEVILCVGYKRSHIQKHVGAGRKWGLRVKYSIEKELLGTGGALRQAIRLISGKRIVVVNGDTFLDISLSHLVQFHESRKARATVTAVEVLDNRRYGSLRLDVQGRITAFLEKAKGDEDKKSGTTKKLINGGVYVFERELLKSIHSRVPVSLEKEVFPSLINRKNVFGYATEAYFLDIGLPEDLKRAGRELPARFHAHGK